MPTDVRRSARGALPITAKPAPPASTASTSSLSSGRQDRIPKSSDAVHSATPHSRSSEEMSEPPRRSQRAHQPKIEEPTKKSNGVDEDAVDEEEVTRCVCGQQEYPGPPLSEAFDAAALDSEDAGGLFISCDGCSVWQHGGCVGIVEESEVPDKYFCEECRPKLHSLHTDSRGYVWRSQCAFCPVFIRLRSSTAFRGQSQWLFSRDGLTVPALVALSVRSFRKYPARTKGHSTLTRSHASRCAHSQWRALLHTCHNSCLRICIQTTVLALSTRQRQGPPKDVF